MQQKMTRVALLLVIFSGFAVLPASAQTTVLSVDFIGGANFNGFPSAMGASETAGVAINGMVRSNWNSLAGGNGTGVTGLKTDTGDTLASTAITWSGGSWSTNIADTPGDNRMMKGFLDGTNTAFSLTNLPFTGTYDLYIYFDGDNGGARRNADFTLNGSTFQYGSDFGGSTFNGTYVFTPGNADIAGSNYLVFSGITGSSVSITGVGGFNTDNTPRVPINGFQIAGTVAVVPEASTPFLLCSAAFVLIPLIKRRRIA